MESCTDYHHICIGRKPLRLSWEKNTVAVGARKRSDLAADLYNINHPAMAILCFTGEYSAWPVQFLPQLYRQDHVEIQG